MLQGDKPDNWRTSLSFITTGSAPSIGCLQFAHRTANHKLIVTPPGQGTNRHAQAYLNQFNVHFSAGCTQPEIDASPTKVRQAYADYLNPPQFELYDLRADPGEFVNLAGKPEHQATLERMLSDYHAWQKQIGDPFSDPANIRFWIEQDEKGRNMNYRGQKGFQWGYVDRFRSHLTDTNL